MRKSLFVVSLLCLLITTSAQAGPLPPGGTVSPVPSGSSTGTIIADTGNVAYTLLGSGGTGSAREVVVSGDTFNPNGGLTFVYQVTRVTSDEVGRLTANHYHGFKTDVIVEDAASSPFSGFMSGGVIPGMATRSTVAADGGDVIGFDFGNSLDVSAGNSELLIIRTDASRFASGDIFLIDGGLAKLSGFAPAPEPSTIALMLVGLIALVGYRYTPTTLLRSRLNRSTSIG
jgi:hypothetical protein